MSDFIVKIEFKNEKLETVVEKEYDFSRYTDMLYAQLMGILKEMEDAFYAFENGNAKPDWQPETKERFRRIRNKMLDEANSIKRLPQTLSYQGVSPMALNSGAYMAQMIDRMQ